MKTAYVEIDEGYRVKCRVSDDITIHSGDWCVVETDRVLEYGKIIAQGEENAAYGKSRFPALVRQATLQDSARADEGARRSKMALETCSAKAEKYGLAIRFVKARFSFDMAVLYACFESDDRVDTRELAKDLTAELRARIVLKHLGVRDAAALVGGMGACGRRLCCCSWMRRFEPVNVRMAKAQRLSLNPGAISGMCGRLKCCLRFEADTYTQMDRMLPKEGEKIECPEGVGTVIGKSILSRKVIVRLDDDGIVESDADQIKRARMRDRIGHRLAGRREE